MNSTDLIISAVDHVIEPPTVWTDRLPQSKFGKRIPHIERSADGADRWIVDGGEFALVDMADVGALMRDRVAMAKQWDDIPKAAHDPAARLKAMDDDGVDYSVLYPSLAGFSGERFGALIDPGFSLACAQAYNDWLIDEWVNLSERFIPQCIVPLSPIDATVAEIRRSVGRGHRGVIFPAAPMQLAALPHINSAEYDPVWAVCQELHVPLCFRAGSTPELFQFPPAPTMAPELVAALQAATRSASAVFDLTNILFSRILLRFPKLKVIFAGSTVGWGTFLLEYADHQYEQDHCNYPLKPSEMFRRQCYLTAWYDDIAIHARHIGSNNILWASNFPAANATWPESRRYRDKCFSGVKDDDQRRIVWGNAAELYRIDANWKEQRP
jgi:predicted TIM-barrel fold metal-dependent hydrolase